MGEVPLYGVRDGADEGWSGEQADPPFTLEATQGKWMVSLVNSHANATRIGWHLWEIDFRFAPGLPPGWPCRVTAARSAHALMQCYMHSRGDIYSSGSPSTEPSYTRPLLHPGHSASCSAPRDTGVPRS